MTRAPGEPPGGIPLDLPIEPIHTERLTLLPLPLAFCEAIVEGERARAARILGHPIGSRTDDWPNGDEVAYGFPVYVQRLREDPSIAAWQGRAILHQQSGIVIGSVNLKGRPRHGRVEVGYGLVSDARGRGYAREATAALVRFALTHPAVHEVIAVIQPANTASIRVAESLGFRRTGELSSEHAGSYVWVLRRGEFEAEEGEGGDGTAPYRSI